MELLRRLTQACGVAGDETPLARELMPLLEPLGPVTATPLGSLVCRVLQAPEDRPHLVLEAHMDEIGLMVTRIEEERGKGFLRVAQCGGVDRRCAMGSPVVVHGLEGPAPGVLWSQQGDVGRNPTMEQLFVDTGLTAGECRDRFPLGTRISFVGPVRELLEDKISSKALDDRCGCAAMIRACFLLRERRPDCSVTLLLSTMEEVGGMGAATGGYSLLPYTHSIGVDVSFGLIPELKEHQAGRLGDGPMVGHNPILDREMSHQLERVAKERGIIHQVKVYAGYRTGTDADGLILAGPGAKGACVCIPLRNMHTPVEVICAGDVEQTAQLAAAYAQALAGEGSGCPLAGSDGCN